MGHTSDSSFFGHFRNLLRARLKFDTFLILRFGPEGRPEAYDYWLAAPSLRRKYPDQYLDGAYRLDPFFRHRDQVATDGMFRLADIAPDRFFAGEYYLQYYQQTRIRDEVGFLARTADGSVAHLSMSRLDGSGTYRRRELQCLRHFSPLIAELLRQYVSWRAQGQVARPVIRAPRPLEELIRAHLRSTRATSLTPREAQVSALILQGHSNLSAALALGISRETAKVHRRNIYRKLMISSQAELFALLTDLF